MDAELPARAAGGSDGAVRLAGNQPTDSVLWFWPFHSHSSRLHKREEERVRNQRASVG